MRLALAAMAIATSLLAFDLPASAPRPKPELIVLEVAGLG